MEKRCSIAFVFLFVGLISFGQKEEVHIPKLKAALMMANSHVPTAANGDKRIAIIPAWGLDMDFFFHKKWSIDLQTDLKLQSFEVEDGETVLERSYPFSLASVIHYYTKEHWSFYAGPGYEFERSENLFFFKLGTEYGFEINENFEIALNLAYENKKEIYDAWTFGVAFSTTLWEKR